MGQDLFVQFETMTSLSALELVERHFRGEITDEPERHQVSARLTTGIHDVYAAEPPSGLAWFAFGDCLGVPEGAKPDVSGWLGCDHGWRYLDQEATAQLVATVFAGVLADPDVGLTAVAHCEWILLAVKVPEFVVVPRWDLAAFERRYPSSVHDLPLHVEVYAPALRQALEQHELRIVEVDMPVGEEWGCDGPAFAELIGNPGKTVRARRRG